MAATVEVRQSPSLLKSPLAQAATSSSPEHQHTGVANKRKHLSCVLEETTEETTEDICPSGLGGGDSNTCSDGRSGSGDDHGQGSGGLKNEGENSSDSDVEVVVSQLEERGKLERRRQSLATKQIKDLADIAANEAASGSMADSSIIHRLSNVRISKRVKT